MNSLYILCLPWQLTEVRKVLLDGETVGTDDYCFRPNTYVIRTSYPMSQQREAEARHNELRAKMRELAIAVPMQ